MSGGLLGQVPGVGALTKLPGLARDIPLPLLHPLLFVTGTESHRGMGEVPPRGSPRG